MASRQLVIFDRPDPGPRSSPWASNPEYIEFGGLHQDCDIFSEGLMGGCGCLPRADLSLVIRLSAIWQQLKVHRLPVPGKFLKSCFVGSSTRAQK